MPHYFNINYIFSPEEVRKRIDESLASDCPAAYICVADGNILQRVHRDPEYRKVVNGAMFSICDSSWVPVYLKKLYGLDVPQYCGSRIFEDMASSCKYRQCFLGTTRNVLDGLKRKLVETDPAVDGMLFMELPFCAVEDFDYEGIAKSVEESGADMIWVSLGAPKQEIFASRLARHLKKGIIIPVGAVFNFFSGVGQKRAPAWMVKHHLEFVHRLATDPGKQLRRCSMILFSLPGIIREEKNRRFFSTEDAACFIELLRMAIGDGVRPEGMQLSEAQWTRVCKIAEKQSVLGLIARAMAVLPDELIPPLGIRARLNFYAEQIARCNVKFSSHAAEITDELAQMGLSTCVLKGQGTAALYADPGSRQCGDIDLWVYGTSADADLRSMTIRAIESRWSHGPCFYHHTGISPFEDGTEVEVHFTPTWMNDFFDNHRLQHYFRSIASELAASTDTGASFPGFRVPPSEFNLVFNAIHIYRHLLADGVGLRQIIDYWHILRVADAEDLRQAFIVLKSLKMKRFVGALMYVEQQLFLLEDEHLLCSPDARYGSFLVNEIFLAGNFGHCDTRFEYDTYGSLPSRAFSRMSRLLHFMRYAPFEVLWAPAFKVWQWMRFLKFGR